MAAFTTLALLGLAAGGGLFAGAQIAKAKNQGTPAPEQALGGPGPVTPTPPPSLALTNAAATSAASTAANRQRKKALGGDTLATGQQKSTQPAAGAMLQPRTLLGY